MRRKCAELNKSKLSLIQIRRKGNLDLIPPAAKKDAEAKFVREVDNTDCKEEAKLSYGIHVKSMFECEKDLTQNLTILWATIMGQCTPALQEEVHGEPDYKSKYADFDSVWLLQTLQKITGGVNKTTNKYYSVFKAMKRLLHF